MNLINKIRCLFNDDYCEVPDHDYEFHSRTEQIRTEQDDIEARLRALGAQVDLHVQRDRYSTKHADITEGTNDNKR